MKYRIPPGHSVRLSVGADGALTIEGVGDVADEGDRILSVRDVAQRLKRTERTIRSYLSRKRNPLPHSKPGGSIVVYERDLNEWVANRKISR